jgi:hypothetical protein
MTQGAKIPCTRVHTYMQYSRYDEYLLTSSQVGAPGPEANPSPKKCYAIARGRTADSVGKYTSWAMASAEVEGVINACFKSFDSEVEEKFFILAYKEQRDVTPSSLQAAVQELPAVQGSMLSMPQPTPEQDGNGSSGMGGRISCPDPS